MKKPLKKPVLNMWRLEKGQSLVETALIFPFLLILIIGIVEASIALRQQLIVVNAAREGARFGACGADADAIYAVTLDAASDIIDFNEENAIITIVYAKTNPAGNALNKWVENVYPDWAMSHVDKKKILADLRKGIGCTTENASPCTIMGDLAIVIVDIRYEHQSVFHFPIIGALADRIPIGSWTVMRIPGWIEEKE